MPVDQAFAADDLNRFLVGNAFKGLGDFLKGFNWTLDEFQLQSILLQHSTHHRPQKFLDEVHVLLQIAKGHFGFNHPEFRKVPAGFGFLRPEGGTKGVDFSHGHGHGLPVQLTALAEVGWVAVEIGGKEGGGPFAGIVRKDGGVHLDKAAVLKKAVDSHDERISNAHDGPLPFGTQPEVAMIHEEVHAVFFGRDWKVFA